MPSLPYSKLDTKSKSKLASVLERLHKSGLKRNDIFRPKDNKQLISDKELRLSLGFKGKKASFEGLKRNIKSIGISKERKEGSVNLTLPKYTKFGFRGHKLDVIQKELRQTSGINIFFDIQAKVQKEFNLTKGQALRQTKAILEIAKTNYTKLNQREKIILSYFS